MFPNLVERVKMELPVPQGITANVYRAENPKYAVWKGGAMLADQSTFLSRCVSKEDYDEVGPSAIHAKCFL